MPDHGDDVDEWVAATKAQYDDDTNLAARQAVFSYLVEAVPIPPPIGDFSVLAGKRVLDVGCGNGLFLRQAHECGAHVIGGDLSAGMLATVASSLPAAPLVLLNAEQLPVADDAVDVTLALWMLYHVKDRASAVRELRRVTVGHGYAIATTNSGRTSFLEEMVGDALETVLGRSVASVIPPLAFNAENGAEILGRGFDEVQTVATGNRFHITDPEVVVRYVGSMLEVIRTENGPFDNAALLTEVGRRAAARIAENGHLELHQRGAVFTCR
jgi:ubiquinone/menaquinone biosynthesis C-methylase UbiE